jgi:hypothetical protein
MSDRVVASVPLEADREALDRAAGKPGLYEAGYTESDEARVRAWGPYEDRAEAEQAVTRLNEISGVSAEIEDSRRGLPA